MNKYEALKIRQILDNPDLSNNERMWEVSLLVDEALEQPAQEPVAWMLMGIEDQKPKLLTLQIIDNVEGTWTPLYTHPHQWQGLTEDEIVKELERTDEYMGKSFFAGVRWAEQALKEKNDD